MYKAAQCVQHVGSEAFLTTRASYCCIAVSHFQSDENAFAVALEKCFAADLTGSCSVPHQTSGFLLQQRQLLPNVHLPRILLMRLRHTHDTMRQREDCTVTKGQSSSV